MPLTRLLATAELRRFVRFVLVGLANTAIGVALFALFFRLTGDHILAGFASAALAIMIGFFLTGRVVFGHLSWRSLVLYLTWYAGLALLNTGLIAAAVALGVNPYVSSIVAAPGVMLVSWFMNRYVIFGQAPRPTKP